LNVMDKHRIGLLTVSDGRQRVYESLEPVIKEYNDSLARVLEETGEVEVVQGTAPIASPEAARREAKRLVEMGVSATIFHQPIFGFPHFAAIVAQFLRPPFLVLAPREPNYPSVNGMLTIGSAFGQLEIPHVRIWDDIEKPEVLAKVMAFVRAAAAVNQLRGQVYGLLGGRSMGLYACAPAPNQWMRQFGVDVDHLDQLEIVRRAELVDAERVARGIDWLRSQMGDWSYDEEQLTPKRLEYQVRTYLATKDIIAEYGWDFVGIKCHYEMSEYQVTQCLSAAFLNDPYDWEGPKVPTPASCEADSDAALTMQLLRLVSGHPASLLDIRFFDEEVGLWVLVNCGAAPTFFADRSQNAAENLRHTKLTPVISKYLGGGAHVWFQFRQGPVTVARLQRAGDRYQMLLFKGEVEERPLESVTGAMATWPTAFARFEVTVETLLQRMNANHLHMIPGDFTQEMRLLGQFLDVEVIELAERSLD
jgi:L-fucose/D-arabinose isomerase